MLTPAKIDMLVPLPSSVSVNNAWLLFENSEKYYIYKNVPSIVVVMRVHAALGTQLECILRSHAVWISAGVWDVTLRKIDTLHVYSEEELFYIQRMNKRLFDDKILAVATPEQMQKLDGTKYVLGRSLLQEELY